MIDVPAWRDARSVLAVRLDGMGDVLMTTPALRALKDARPDRRLTLLASPAGARVARELPFVDDTLEFRAPWMKHDPPATDGAASAALVRRLRKGGFDAAVVFTVCTQSALPCATVLHQAGIARRAAHCRENPYALLTDWVRDSDVDLAAGVRHETARQLDLVRALGVRVRDVRLQFPVGHAARARFRAKAAGAGLDPVRTFIVLHPGATAASRRYPPEAFGEAARLLRARGYEVVLAGGDGDAAAVETIAQCAPGVASLAGQLELAELAALLECATAVVCNNSFPAHLAAAVGTPVVDLYALTNPQHTPWAVLHRVLNHDVECRNCQKSVCPQGHHRCLAGVAPADVVAATLAVARRRPAPQNRTAGAVGALPALAS